MKSSTMDRIEAAVLRARGIHPTVQTDMMLELFEEVGEIARAILDGGSRSHVESEVLDTIAVLVRMLEGE